MSSSERPRHARRLVTQDSMERRKYARIRAPLRYRPVDTPLLADQGDTLDISLGGARLYSAKPLPFGALLWLEIAHADGSKAKYRVKVMWSARLPAGSPAPYDVGVRFMAVEGDALRFLLQVLNTS